MGVSYASAKNIPGITENTVERVPTPRYGLDTIHSKLVWSLASAGFGQLSSIGSRSFLLYSGFHKFPAFATLATLGGEILHCVTTVDFQGLCNPPGQKEVLQSRCMMVTG